MRKARGKLEPVDQMSAEDLALLPADKDLLVTAKAPRNIRHHRLAWALAQKLADACDFLHDREDAMNYLKIKARHVKIVQDGERVYLIPKSIAFASLRQDGFARLFNRMIWIVCNDILPGVAESDLRREIEEMCFGERERAA